MVDMFRLYLKWLLCSLQGSTVVSYRLKPLNTMMESLAMLIEIPFQSKWVMKNHPKRWKVFCISCGQKKGYSLTKTKEIHRIRERAKENMRKTCGARQPRIQINFMLLLCFVKRMLSSQCTSTGNSCQYESRENLHQKFAKMTLAPSSVCFLNVHNVDLWVFESCVKCTAPQAPFVFSCKDETPFYWSCKWHSMPTSAENCAVYGSSNLWTLLSNVFKRLLCFHNR